MIDVTTAPVTGADRGTEFLTGCYAILDRAPKGGGEGDQPISWLRRHDEYHNQ